MHEERLGQLLLAWQEQQLQGRDLSAAALCLDCPELAEELGQRIQVLRQMDALVQNETAKSGPLNDPAEFPTTPTDGRQLAPVPAAAKRWPNVPGYEIVGELGRGGMGVVYKAHQVKLSRLVALKMVLAGQHAGPQELARFQAEALAVARLQHPHIVQVYDVGNCEGLPFFSLEYLDGGSLDRQLAGTPLQGRAAARLVQTLARTVHYAHQRGIVHRDLKPSNILLQIANSPLENENRPEDNSHFAIGMGQWAIPKISDFGLAKHLDGGTAQTQTGSVLGTPSYMAPEQAAGETKKIGPATDVYALGAILYECLTGRPPFRAATPLDTVAQVVSAEPVPPRQLQLKVPRDLETICLKCLQKEPVERYGSALALAEDLQRLLEGQPILARPVGRSERLWRWCRRNPIVASLSGLLLLVLVAGMGALTHLWLSAEHQRLRAVEEGRRAEKLAAQARQQQALAEAQTAVAEAERKRARAEATKASKVAQIMAQMFEASDPLGLNNLPLPKPKRAEALAARKLLDRAGELIARELGGEPDVQARLLDTIGNVYCTLGFTDKAKPFLDQALALRLKALPKNHPDVAATLHNLAWLHHQSGNYSQARKLYGEALVIRRRHAAANPLPMGSTMLNLAWLLADMENFAPAEKMLKDVIELRRRQQGEGHRDVAVARVALAGVFLAQGKCAAAVMPYLQARATLLKVAGGKELAESIDLLQRGLLVRELPAPAKSLLGGAEEAVNCLKRSLQLAKQELGDQHAYVALVLHELARAESRSGKYAEAEQHYRDCLLIARRYGLEHPKTTILLWSFCSFLRDRGKPEEAQKILREALHERRRRRGPNHHLVADVLLLSVELSTVPAERSERERLLREAAAIYRKSPDASRRNFARCLNLLAISLPATSAAEAEHLLREALPLARKHFGPNHAFVTLLLCNLATIQMNQKKHEKVEPVLREVLAILRQGGSPDIDTGRYAWRCLGRYYLATGHSAKAAAAALERRKLAGDNSNELYDVAAEMARCAAAFRVETPESSKYADLAMQTLQQARAKGFKNSRLLRTDKAFHPLRGRPDFQKLLQELEGPGNKQGDANEKGG